MFCSRCGSKLPDDSKSCNECGFEAGKAEINEKSNRNAQNPYQPNYNYEQSSQTYQSAQPPNQPNQQYQPYYVPVYTKPRRPGKGFGITSMILGIFGIVYSSMLSLIALQAILYSFAYDSGNIDIYKNMKMIMGNFFESDNTENIIAIISTCLVCAILALIFYTVSKNKGYRSSISKSGFILSIVSFALVFAFVSFTWYAYTDSPSKGIDSSQSRYDQNDEDKLIGTWVATDKVSTVTFENDGKGKLGGYGFPTYFTYSINNDKLTLIMDNGYEVINFTYKIEGNKFTWTNEEDGNVMVFTKRK